ncbi:MAG TPA: O-antigen ligase family protein [Dokdonella sp.]|uniref:O-antigen ligase family protein n=1 Tax=Dokdonella sp. TaxID=2291710 RepID=UPI002D7F3942|nr:O-antigen ligase family protein [Dokdonella sp.]HET9032244.1 O-antigen ligase family protein [Dokdonella sp.]
MLSLCFIAGGSSATGNLGTMAAQLLAIPILVYSVVQAQRQGLLRLARGSVLVVMMIALLPLLQLIPLPAWLWSLPPERLSLWSDLQAAGVATVDKRWTLSAYATERDLLFLLPGIALFFCLLGSGRTVWRNMLWLIIGLSVANLILAFAQIAAGQQSFLNPYPDYAPAMAGIFANRNHQASMLAIGLMLVTVFLLNALRQARNSSGPYAKVWVLVFAALSFILALPLVGSRAGVIVAMIMFLGAILSSGLPSAHSFRRNRLLQIGSLLALAVFVIGLQAALGWMRNDAGDSAIEGSRYRIAAETLQIGIEYAPLGAGFGTFIPAFKQGSSDVFLMRGYVNNAHNEYAQWWLEGGVLGVIVVLLALIVLIKALVRLLRQNPQSRTRTSGIAALMGIGVIILHSTVDYPLRTPALMAVFAVLSGIAVAAANTVSNESARDRKTS